MAVSTIQNASLASGVPASANMPAGSVLQVVSNVAVSTGTYFSTTSTSMVSTGFSVSITPKFSTSKILLLHSAMVENANDSIAAYFTMYRNSTNLATGAAPSSLAVLRVVGGYGTIPMHMQFLDSPATTSSTTYTAYMATGSATSYYGINQSGSHVLTFIAMEIAA